MFMRQRPLPISSSRRSRHVTPLYIIGAGIPLLIALIAGSAFFYAQIASHAANVAAAVNPNCTLVVPQNPLTAQGLATPYQLAATNPALGPCNEANVNQSAFVQGSILNPATGKVSLYDPLVIDQGTQPAVVPTAPQLPANAIVGLWFGFQGTNLTLQDTMGSLMQGQCVNGAANSVFGEFAYCNAPAFFQGANLAIQNGLLQVPAPGVGNDGLQCLTTRDFGLVDQDQSDNVTTSYLLINNQIAQNTAANRAQAVANANAAANPAAPVILTNASDNLLLTGFEDKALGCTPMMAPNLADNGAMAPSLPLDELQAAAAFANAMNNTNTTANPVPQTAAVATAAAAGNTNLMNAMKANALNGMPLAKVEPATAAIVPLNDPMVLNNANPDPQKEAMYQVGVDQPQTAVNGTTYCMNLGNIGPARIAFDMNLTQNATSPNAQVANSLYTFLANRINQSWMNLNCAQLLGQQGANAHANAILQGPRNDFNPFKNILQQQQQQQQQMQLPFIVQMQNNVIVQATLNPNFTAMMTNNINTNGNNANGGTTTGNGNNANGNNTTGNNTTGGTTTGNTANSNNVNGNNANGGTTNGNNANGGTTTGNTTNGGATTGNNATGNNTNGGTTTGNNTTGNNTNGNNTNGGNTNGNTTNGGTTTGNDNNANGNNANGGTTSGNNTNGNNANGGNTNGGTTTGGYNQGG